MPPPDPTIAIGFRLPLSLKTALDKEAKRRGIASSLLIREAVVQYIELPPARAVMKPPGDKIAKQRRANEKRKQGLAALKMLQKHNPELLARIAADHQKEEKAG